MTWICKKCGQIQPDSIIYGDGICDDCFEKINKKKKKGSAFNKILSLALVLSFMLCIFSGFGVASAEGVSDLLTEVVSDGTYMGYDVIEFDKEEVLSGASLKALYDKYFGSIDGNCNLFVYLMEFDDTGKPLFYSASYATFLTINPASTTSYRCSLSGQPTVIPLERIGTEYKYINYKYTDKNTFAFLYCKSDSTTVKSYEYAISYTNGEKGFSGFVSDTRYLVFVPFNSTEESDATIFSNFVNGTKDEDFNLIESSTLPKANFYTCKSAPFTDTSHGLWVKSWLKDGEQYPYFGWWINDNGNNHKYKVVFSYNDTQKELFETFYNSTKSNPLFSDGWWVEKAFPILSVSKDSMIIANEMATQTGFADFMANKTWWMWHYNTLFTLNHSSMDFTSQTGNKIYSINLSDYSSVYEYLFYRAQIVDVTTGNILDTVYFTSQESYNKSDSGYGSKVYDYGDNSQGMIDDLKNNTPSVDPDNFGDFISDGDVIEGGILDDNGNLNYEFNINQIVGTLNNATVGMGQFFSACMNIIPSAFISILMGSFALIVLLRVLGR